MHRHCNLYNSLMAILTAEILLDLKFGLYHFIRAENSAE